MKVYQQGHSLVLRIPKNVADELSVEAGSEFRCTFEGKSIVLERDASDSAYSWQSGKRIEGDLKRVGRRRRGVPTLAELNEQRDLGYTVSWVYASRNGVDHTFHVELG